jgi:hypothetical protein
MVLALKLMMWRSKSKHVSDLVFAADIHRGKAGLRQVDGLQAVAGVEACFGESLLLCR